MNIKKTTCFDNVKCVYINKYLTNNKNIRSIFSTIVHVKYFMNN